ncbi:hypothetical protein KY284_035839 [Solanum tuberosum]|nr:hypothetical protein KY284_035839 [Solanum tuberosum]
MTGETATTAATLTTTQTITGNASVIDHNHPYHLHASDTPGMTIVNNPFDGKDLQAWNRCNEMVTSCILNSLSKEIADIVIYSKTVRELWISLEHIFGQSNGAKLYHLQKELSRLIGFPDDFQFTHDKGFNNQVKENGDPIRGNGVMTMEETDNEQDFGINISNENYSQEQYNQFVKMFKHMKVEEDTNSGMKINANALAATIDVKKASFYLFVIRRS